MLTCVAFFSSNSKKRTNGLNGAGYLRIQKLTLFDGGFGQYFSQTNLSAFSWYNFFAVTVPGKSCGKTRFPHSIMSLSCSLSPIALHPEQTNLRSMLRPYPSGIQIEIACPSPFERSEPWRMMTILVRLYSFSSSNYSVSFMIMSLFSSAYSLNFCLCSARFCLFSFSFTMRFLMRTCLTLCVNALLYVPIHLIGQMSLLPLKHIESNAFLIRPLLVSFNYFFICFTSRACFRQKFPLITCIGSSLNANLWTTVFLFLKSLM